MLDSVKLDIFLHFHIPENLGVMSKVMSLKRGIIKNSRDLEHTYREGEHNGG